MTVGSPNIFEDLGFENPEEELAKARLVSALTRVIRERGLTQTQVARMVGIDQPTVSKLLQGRTGGFTSDRLMRLLLLLGLDIEISVRPKRNKEARVTVSLAQVL